MYKNKNNYSVTRQPAWTFSRESFGSDMFLPTRIDKYAIT